MTLLSEPAATPPQSSLDRLEQALRARGDGRVTRLGKTLTSRCPVHDDRTPSLSAKWIPDNGGATLVYCHGCHAHALDIVQALGLALSDLYDAPLPARERRPWRTGKSQAQRAAGKRRGKPGRLPALITDQTPDPEPVHDWQEVQRYPYVDADGAIVQFVLREVCTREAVPHKQFRQVFINAAGREVKSKPAGFSPVLYRTPEVLAAVAAGTPVWLLEGEKDVHTAEEHGLVATTNAQGGRSFPDHLCEVLRGAQVNVVLDRDATGWSRGLHLHRLLTDVDAQVRLLLPATQREKSDFTDHIEAGHGIDDLQVVSVQEVAVWDTLSAAEQEAGKVRTACEQAKAHHHLADASSREEHLRHAKRWAVESEIVFERLKVRYDQVWASGIQVGTLWVEEALARAQALLTSAAHAATTVHRLLDMPVPGALEPPEPGATAPEAGESADSGAQDRPDDAAGRIDDRLGAPLLGVNYAIINGQVARFEPGRNREDGGTWKPVINTAVRVRAMEYRHDKVHHEDKYMTGLGRANRPTGTVTTKLRQLESVVLEYVHPVSGEWLTVRVTDEQWDNHSYLRALPSKVPAPGGSGELVPLDYDRSRGGLDRLRRAILAVSTSIEDVTIYRSTGWTAVPDEPDKFMFVHAGGGISARGNLHIQTDFEGPLRFYDLPDPSTDPGVLRQAWLDCSVIFLHLFPARIIAPVWGQVYRSFLSKNPYSLLLVGLKESGKTGLAALGMHHWGELWDRLEGRRLDSGTGNGNSPGGSRIILSLADGALGFIDDFTTDKAVDRGQEFLDTLIRMIFNEEARFKQSRDGKRVYGGEAPRCSGLLTSEFDALNMSARQRCFPALVHPGDLDWSIMKELDVRESRNGRALIGSSLLQWIAEDREARLSHYAELKSTYMLRFVKELGYNPRKAESTAELLIGWIMMTDFLQERGAISADEAASTRATALQGLLEAVEVANDPDQDQRLGDTIISHLRYALTSGLAYADESRHVERRDGLDGMPPVAWAARVGWARNPAAAGGWERKGRRFGWIRHDPRPGEERRPWLIALSKSTLLEVLRDVGNRTGKRINADERTILRELFECGALKAETWTTESGATRFRFDVKTDVEAQPGRERRPVLYLDVILGDDQEQLDDTPDDDGPQPVDVVRMLLDGDGTPDVGGLDQLGEDAAMPTHPPVVVTRLGDDDPLPGEHAAPPAADAAAPLQASAAASDDVPAPGEVVDVSPDAPARPVSPDAPADPPRTRVRQEFRAAAAVCDVDTVYLSNGDVIDMPGDGPKHVGDLVRLAEYLRLGTQVTKYLSEPGQIWLTAAQARRLQIDVSAIEEAGEMRKEEVTMEVTKNAPVVADALADGYAVGQPGNCLRAWTKVWKPGQSGQATWVVLIPTVMAKADEVLLLDGEPDPGGLARRIHLLTTALGMPLHLMPAETGIDLMLKLRHKDRDRMFTPYEPCEPAQSNHNDDCAWWRPPTEEEAGHGWVHFYDRNGSYLPVLSGLNLGLGEPTHYPQPDAGLFDPKLPGYWQIDIPHAGDWRLPNPLDPKGHAAGKPGWVTTPSLEIAHEMGYDPQILQAYVWHEHARVLDPWYARLRDARTQLLADPDDPDMRIALGQLKRIYTASLGKMGSHQWMKGRPGYAPDRWHAVMSKAKANILRRVLRNADVSGRWPVSVGKDTIVYTSPDPDPVAAWPGEADWLGTGLGRYKVERSMPLAEYLPILNKPAPWIRRGGDGL